MNRNLNQLNNLYKMTKIIQVYKKSMVNGSMRNCLDENCNQKIIGDRKSVLKELEPNSIKEANDLLNQGKIIALPTDTIYGIACLVDNDDSLQKLNGIKQRDLNKPISICVNNLNDVYKWSKVTVDKKILEQLLPGPVTIFFERTELLNQNFNPFTNLVGIRIPDDGFVHSLTYHNNPLALTSANLTSEPSAGSIEEFKKLWPKLDAIFDGGQLNGSDPFRLGSTIVDLSVPNKFRIIRKGCAIDRVLNVLQNKYNFEELI